MMREIDTEQPVVWPEWCYNTTGESRSAASPSSSSGDQKGCGLATMNHGSTRKNTHSPSPLQSAMSSSSPSAAAAAAATAASAATNGSLVSALNGHPGLSFLTSQMAMSASKLLQLAQKHQQQQNYRPTPPSSSNNINGQAPPPVSHGVKRKHLESAVALLSDRLSPAGSANNTTTTNNNSFSVNNLNLEKFAHRLNGQHMEESSYLPKNLTITNSSTAKDFNGSSHRASPPTAIKSERISPINFNNGKAANGRSSSANAAGRSRSSTPSSSSVVFNSSSSLTGGGGGAASNNGGNNGTLGLNGSNGTGQPRNGSSSLGELSLSRPAAVQLHHQQQQQQQHHHHQLSTHHHPTFGQQQHQSHSESRIHGTAAENLQQSTGRQGEPQQARNYSDMIRSLAAKYNNNSSNNDNLSSNNGHLISPNAAGGVTISGGQPPVQQRFSNNSHHSSGGGGGSASNGNNNNKREEMGASSAAALRLLSSNHNGGQVTAKRSRSRSPAVTVPSTPNKASLNNPSLAASLAASQQSPHDHSSTSAAAAEQSSLISSFLRLPASMFTPMIDMTSTQALVTLARAAKEAEFLNLLSSSPSSSSAAAATGAGATSCVSSAASSSSSSVSSPRTNGGSSSAAAIAARKRLQTTRNVFNATAAANQKNPRGNASLLINGGSSAVSVGGGYPSAGLSATSSPLAPPPPPPPATFSASLLAAAAAAASNNAASKGRSMASSSALNLHLNLSSAAPLDLSAGPQLTHPPEQCQVADEEEEDPRQSMKRMKYEPHLSPSPSPGPDSGIGEMITMNGGRDASGGSSSDSESPVRRSEGSPSPRQSMDTKWATGCNHQAEMDEMRSWSVQQVCEFISTIDICAEYAKNFQEQSIDGTGLPLLTEEHLRNLLSMKLGPALKVKAILATRMGTQCQKCGGQNAANSTAAASPSPSTTDSESRRMSQCASSMANRRSVSPAQVKLPMDSDSFVAFRTKMEALSPNYSLNGDTAPCEGMIATMTMTAAPGGRSTPNEGDARAEASPNGKDIPMKVEHLLSGADR